MAGRNSALYKHSGPAEPRSELSSSSYSRNYNVQEISEPIPSARTFAPSSPNRASRTVEVTDLDRLLDNPSLSEQPPSLPPKAYKSTAPNMISASNPSPQRTIFQESSYPGSLGTFPASATNIQNSPIRLPTEPPSPSMAFPPSATNTQNAPTRPPTVSPPKALPSSPPAPLSPIDGASRLADSGNSEGEVYLLKQKLQQLEFYKRRCNELSSQNAQLVEERQRLEELLNSSRRNEESAIEQQVQSLVQLDQFKSEVDMDKKQIETLTREVALLQRSFEQQLRREVQNLSAALQNPNALQQAQVSSTLELQEARAHIRELEAQLERTANSLREKERQARHSQSGAAGGPDAKSEQWKILDVQREKVSLRREVTVLSESLEAAKKREAEAASRITTLERERNQTAEELNSVRESHEQHTAELEKKIEELTSAVMLLRRKGATINAAAAVREAELSEAELMYRAVQELSMQISRLRSSNVVLRKNCDRLKAELLKVLQVEDENERLARENLELRRALSTQRTTSEQTSDAQRVALEHDIENRKLRRIVETLRNMLVQLDPHNRYRFNYMTAM